MRKAKQPEGRALILNIGYVEQAAHGGNALAHGEPPRDEQLCELVGGKDNRKRYEI